MKKLLDSAQKLKVKIKIKNKFKGSNKNELTPAEPSTLMVKGESTRSPTSSVGPLERKKSLFTRMREAEEAIQSLQINERKKLEEYLANQEQQAKANNLAINTSETPGNKDRIEQRLPSRSSTRNSKERSKTEKPSQPSNNINKGF